MVNDQGLKCGRCVWTFVTLLFYCRAMILIVIKPATAGRIVNFEFIETDERRHGNINRGSLVTAGISMRCFILECSFSPRSLSTSGKFRTNFYTGYEDLS